MFLSAGISSIMTSCTVAVAALQVYIGHTLSLLLQLVDKLNAEADGSSKMKRCIEACSTMIKYARYAQAVCGPVGLAALDRSEEHLRLCIRSLCAPPRGLQEKTLYSIAASCYAQAINRQCSGDSALRELYIYAALRSDAVAKIQPGTPCHFCNVLSTLDNERRSVPLGKWSTLIAKASELDTQKQALSGSAKLWSLKRCARTAHFYRYAAACAQIAEIHENGNRVFPTTAAEVTLLMRHQFTGAQLAINILDRSAAVYDAADELHPRAELNALAEVAVRRIEEAVTEAAAKPTTPLDREGYELDSGFKYHNTRTTEKNAVALAELVSALSTVVMQVDSLRSHASNSGYRSNTTKNVPAQVLAEAADQLDRLIAEVTGSAGDDSDDALHMWDGERLSAAIAQVADKLKAAQESAASWEERAVERFLVEADKVRREASPAHPHIADCWLHAATQMRLAVEAKAAACTAEGAARIKKHKTCAEAYETLATITFGDAAIYFAKAAGPRASAQARELWREAAELLIETGLMQMRRTEEAAAMFMFTAAALHQQSAAEIATTSRAAACAACATAMDGLAVSEVDSANGLLPGAAPAAADGSTVAQDCTTTGVSYAVLALSMRLLLVQVKRIPLIETANSNRWDPHPGGHDPVRLHLRKAATDTLLLCQSAQVEVPCFPVGHLLYRCATYRGSSTTRPDAARHMLRRYGLLHSLQTGGCVVQSGVQSSAACWMQILSASTGELKDSSACNRVHPPVRFQPVRTTRLRVLRGPLHDDFASICAETLGVVPPPLGSVPPGAGKEWTGTRTDGADSPAYWER
jgi:hypothetical protein